MINYETSLVCLTPDNMSDFDSEIVEFKSILEYEALERIATLLAIRNKAAADIESIVNLCLTGK